MNVHTLTPADKNYLFSLVCYGRATPANMARALGIDRRTAQRLTDDDHLADIIPNPAKGDIGRWYALLDTKSHAWSTTDGCYHFEARTAAILRDNLAARVLESVGDALKQRMIAECPKIWNGNALTWPVAELREALDRNFAIPDTIRDYYRRTSSPTFRDTNGREL